MRVDLGCRPRIEKTADGHLADVRSADVPVGLGREAAGRAGIVASLRRKRSSGFERGSCEGPQAEQKSEQHDSELLPSAHTNPQIPARSQITGRVFLNRQKKMNFVTGF